LGRLGQLFIAAHAALSDGSGAEVMGHQCDLENIQKLGFPE
jgi:hypothetical protein